MRGGGTIWEEILRHLAEAPRAKLKIALEIEAEDPESFSEHVRQVVGANASTLKLRQAAFEEE